MDIQLISLRSLINHQDAILDATSKKFLNSINIDNQLKFTSDTSPLKIFYIETGGSEIKFKEIYKNYTEPYYLLTSDNSNSLASALEILTFLQRNNLSGEIIYGDKEEIFLSLYDLMNSFRAIEELDGQNLGIIGKPSDWLIGSNVNYKDAKDIYSINLIDISEEELIKEINKHLYIGTPELDSLDKYASNKETLKGALEIYGALKRLISRYNLSGLTIRCFDLLSLFHNTSCLALALLNQEGITATCEGDIPAFISMHLVNVLLYSSSFQANPARVDLQHNMVTFAHCTVPLDMVSSFKFDSHFESGLGIGIKGELNKEDCTIIKLNPDLDDLYINEGHIEKNLCEKNLCRTQIVVKLDNDITDYFSEPYGNHMIILYGRWGYEFSLLMELLMFKMYSKKEKKTKKKS